MKLAEIVLQNERTETTRYGGYDPYTFAFVYCEETAFLVKGYLSEVNAFLKNMKVKALVNKQYFNRGERRGYWELYYNGENIPGIHINQPTLEYSRRDYPGREKTKWVRKYKIWGYNSGEEIKSLELKRLPKKWIPEFDRFIPKESIMSTLKTYNRLRYW